jgi:hypothetical protein
MNKIAWPIFLHSGKWDKRKKLFSVYQSLAILPVKRQEE